MTAVFDHQTQVLQKYMAKTALIKTCILSGMNKYNLPLSDCAYPGGERAANILHLQCPLRPPALKHSKSCWIFFLTEPGWRLQRIAGTRWRRLCIPRIMCWKESTQAKHRLAVF